MGKGSKSRISDQSKYNQGFSRIFGSKPSNTAPVKPKSISKIRCFLQKLRHFTKKFY